MLGWKRSGITALCDITGLIGFGTRAREKAELSNSRKQLIEKEVQTKEKELKKRNWTNTNQFNLTEEGPYHLDEHIYFPLKWF